MIRRRPSTDVFFVHCSATRAKQDIGAKTIHKWHVQRGIYNELGLTGYHYVIRRSGAIELGRPLPVIGAHTLGYNDVSVGICLVGGARKARPDETPEWSDMVSEDNFERAQKEALRTLLEMLKLVYPTALLAPHNAVAAKGCPSFDVWAWQKSKFGADDRLAFLKWNAEREG